MTSEVRTMPKMSDHSEVKMIRTLINHLPKQLETVMYHANVRITQLLGGSISNQMAGDAGSRVPKGTPSASPASGPSSPFGLGVARAPDGREPGSGSSSEQTTATKNALPFETAPSSTELEVSGTTDYNSGPARSKFKCFLSLFYSCRKSLLP